MDIVTTDPQDTAALGRAHDVLLAVDGHDRPWTTSWSRAHFLKAFQEPLPLERLVLLTAEDGEQTVGTAVVTLPQRDNLTMAWLSVWVLPSHRRRGVGSALLRDLCRLAVEAGRSELVACVYLPVDERDDHPNARFAAKHGFTVGLPQMERHLALPVPADQLARLAAVSAEYHRGYELHTFVNGMPARLRPSYCRALNSLSVEAPAGEIDFEEECRTEEDLVLEDARLSEIGDALLTTVAVDRSGEVVAFNDLLVHAHSATDVGQCGTLVVPAHRGHRLGMAVKVKGLQELQRRHPERRRVTTSNAEVNAHMVAINERLGFRPVELMAIFRRTVDDLAP